MGNSSILVSWKPPGNPAAPSGYVVEWAEPGRDTHPETHPTWVKLPASNLSTVIAGNRRLEAGCHRGTLLFRKLFKEQVRC